MKLSPHVMRADLHHMTPYESCLAIISLASSFLKNTLHREDAARVLTEVVNEYFYDFDQKPGVIHPDTLDFLADAEESACDAVNALLPDNLRFGRDNVDGSAVGIWPASES